jgi:uncharacterized protein (DUF362 family)/ferredoxin
MTPLVRLLKVDGYGDGRIREFVTSVIGRELPDLRGKKVLVKPNMLRGVNKNLATTTHQSIVSAVVAACKEKGATVLLGDSPGIPLAGPVIARQLGMMDLVEEHGIEFVNFERSPAEFKRIENRLVKTFTLASVLREVDVVINLPKLKTHLSAIYSGAVKNLFGLVPGLLKAQFHVKFPDRARFGQMLADLASIVRPSLSIMDAVVAMEGEGPSNGNPVAMGLLLASADMVALDAVACHLIGLKAADVPAVRCAGADGLGIPDLKKIRIEGVDDLASVKPRKFSLRQSNKEMRFGPAGAFQRWVKRIAIARPVIAGDKCVRCVLCVRMCPANALSGDKGQVPEFGYDLCIRCYCCHEICPEGAITKKETLVSRMLG